MKILIWIGCFILYCIGNTAINEVFKTFSATNSTEIILYSLLKAVFVATAFGLSWWLAVKLCRKWDKWEAGDNMKEEEEEEEEEENPDFEYSVNTDGKTCTITGMGSTSATDFVIPAEIDEYKVTSIDSRAFSGNTSLKSVTIGNNVTSIGYRAFSGCTSLTSVNIPASVTSISSSAFSGCTSLTIITFKGTVAKWKAIASGTDWNAYVPATKVVCSDGTVKIK